MRLLFLICAMLMAGQGVAAAQPSHAGEYVMMVIATAGPANAGTGVSMLRQFFPNAETCANAAKIMQGDIPGGSVTARCYPTR